MSGFIDLHAHIIYGVDDGAQTREDMYDMLDAAAADGVSTLFATSHCTPGLHRFPEEVYERHLALAKEYCRAKGYDLQLYPGAELMYTPALHNAIREKELPTLGGTGWVLLELMPDVSGREIEDAIELLSRVGYLTLLAHIERYDCLYHGSLLNRLRERYPIRCQVNCSTVVDGVSGFFRGRTVRSWFRDGLVDAVSSDAHGCRHRRTRMREAYDTLVRTVGSAEADRLTGRSGSFLARELHLNQL